MPSYTQYKRQIMDADDNIETWITVKGNHIPIMKGQSKEEAVQAFLEKKGSKESSQRESKPTHVGKLVKNVVKKAGENKALREEALGKNKAPVDKTGTGFVKINRRSNKATPNKVTYKELYEGIKSGKTIPEMTGIKSDSDDEMDILMDLQDALGFNDEEFNKLYDQHKKNFMPKEIPGFRELKGTKHQGGTIGLSAEEHKNIEGYNKWARKETRRIESGEAGREANARPILKADKNADVSDIVKNYKKEMKALGENASLAKKDKVEVNAIVDFMTRKIGAGHPYEDYYNYWLKGMSKEDSDTFNEIYSESVNREKAFEKLEKMKSERYNRPVHIGEAVRNVVKRMGEKRKNND